MGSHSRTATKIDRQRRRHKGKVEIDAEKDALALQKIEQETHES
jgi:hypothetical protein